MASKDTKEAPKENFARRDLLLQLQEQSQKSWDASRIFEIDAPEVDATAPKDKFFGTFPYPYMNGLLHLGHAFSLSKLEFASAYHRLCGKKVLFPQAFHCTGMPIKACADKLKREIDTYGCPPNFAKEEEDAMEAAAEEQAAPTGPTDPTKFSGKKSKAAAKTGTAKSQWEILAKSGIPEDQIPAFAESEHWLHYFPPKAKRDLIAMGCGVDWRRSFITTDMNPYYDSFVRWQFLTLKEQGRVVKDKRYAVFSPLDGQPCADHDRASGEGVGPQEYTLIKLEALELNGKLAQLQGKGRVFLMAATLRPETMYGQTNCWVLPEGQYGAFQGLNDEVYIMTQRAALNLSYQELTPERGQPQCLLEVTGQDLIGTPVRAPNCPHERVYVLPLLTILTNKGTGVVTSVPSDSPDDYTALLDLKNKPKLREKFGVRDEWVLPFEVIPIIHIEEFGNMAAKTVCEQLKIQSQNDTAKLAEAKGMVYLKGFTDGVMEAGPHAGKKVSEAKPLIKEELISSGQALPYSEPEKVVMSRSGDECVVALTDQWYLIYGEEEWLAMTKKALERLETYGDDAKRAFEKCLDWLNQWACSRSFGLGTRLPWDPEFLIESLSDSTIYMAYYTVAHILQNDDMYGTTPGAIPPSALTPAVWDHIFLNKPAPTDTPIAPELLAKMRAEFEFWYPFDLRVSGKDLIQNHLTFCLYTHVAIWGEKFWPGGFRCNGHLLLNGDKMSKSTGNFKTLNEAIGEFSADAMRLALADAGDGMDDANFETSTANAAILRLTKELTWVEEMLAAGAGLREGGEATLHDKFFDNQINAAVAATKAAYDKMLFREALKAGFYDLQNCRDVYRFACGESGMSRALIQRYIEVSTLMLAPICPHTCEHIWTKLLGKQGSVLVAGWPQAPAADSVMQRAAQYIEDLIPTLRKTIQKNEAPPKKAGQKQMRVVAGDLFVGERFVGWQETVLKALAGSFDAAAGKFPDDVFNTVMEALKADPALAGQGDKAMKKAAMPFAKYKMEEALKVGPQVLDVKLPFDEAQLIKDCTPYLQRSIKLQALNVHAASDAAAVADVSQRTGFKIDTSAASPGTPLAFFTTEPVA